MVDVENVDGTSIAINVLAETKWAARQRAYAKWKHMQPNQEKYSMGVKVITMPSRHHSLN
jgi:hypothetical protein